MLGYTFCLVGAYTVSVILIFKLILFNVNLFYVKMRSEVN